MGMKVKYMNISSYIGLHIQDYGHSNSDLSNDEFFVKSDYVEERAMKISTFELFLSCYSRIKVINNDHQVAVVDIKQTSIHQCESCKKLQKWQ